MAGCFIFVQIDNEINSEMFQKVNAFVSESSWNAARNVSLITKVFRNVSEYALKNCKDLCLRTFVYLCVRRHPIVLTLEMTTISSRRVSHNLRTIPVERSQTP
jgi:hypothetical protein